MDLAPSGGWVKKALEAPEKKTCKLSGELTGILGGFGKPLEGPERPQEVSGNLEKFLEALRGPIRGSLPARLFLAVTLFWATASYCQAPSSPGPRSACRRGP